MSNQHQKKFWKRLTALVEEHLFIAESNKQVWNQIREYGPADLRVMEDYLEERRDNVPESKYAVAPFGQPEKEEAVPTKVISVYADIGNGVKETIPLRVPKPLHEGKGTDFEISKLWDEVEEELKNRKERKLIGRALYVVNKMLDVRAYGKEIPRFHELTLEALESLGEQSYVGFSEEIKQARRLILEKIEKSGTNMQRQRLNRLEATLSGGSFSDLNSVYYKVIEREGGVMQLESMQKYFKRMFDSASNDTARDRRPGSLEDLEQIAELWRDVRSGQ